MRRERQRPFAQHSPGPQLGMTVSLPMQHILMDWEKSVARGQSDLTIFDNLNAAMTSAGDARTDANVAYRHSVEADLRTEIGDVQNFITTIIDTIPPDDGPGDGGSNGGGSRSVCAVFNTSVESYHIGSGGFDEWNVTEDTRPGHPENGNVNYWGSRQGAASFSRMYAWGYKKNYGERARYRRAFDEGYASVVMSYICLKANGEPAPRPNASLKVHASATANLFTYADAWSSNNRTAGAATKYWVNTAFKNGTTEDVTQLFSKAGEVTYSEYTNWNADWISTALDFAWSVGAAATGGSELSDLFTDEEALDNVTELFTTSPISRGHNGTPGNDVLQVSTDTPVVEITPNTTYEFLVTEDFEHQIEGRSKHWHAMTHSGSDHLLVGVLTAKKDENDTFPDFSMAFSLLGNHQVDPDQGFVSPRKMFELKEMAKQKVNALGWPMLVPEANNIYQQYANYMDGLTDQHVTDFTYITYSKE